MQIGTNKVVVRPAMFVLIGAIVLGVAGVVAASWYSTEHTPGFGYAQPNRWSFATAAGGKATMTMLTHKGTSDLEKTDKGYKHVNADEGLTVDIAKVGTGPQSVYLRNAVSLEGAKSGDYKFSFEGKADKPFQVTFTVRATQQKSGDAPFWSKSFEVKGDWQEYSATIPTKALDNNRMKYIILAGQLANQPGQVTLRHIYLKGS